MKRFIFICGVLILPAALAAAGQHDDKQEKPPPLGIDTAQFAFVRANLVATLYHEFAHALIDQLDLAVLGQEENAADVLSAVMLSRHFRGPVVMAMARDTARGFRADALLQEKRARGWSWWDEHALDWQRYYTFVCLFYGADTAGRVGFAREMGLPRTRAERCGDEYQIARDGWGRALGAVARNTGSAAASGPRIRFRSRVRTPFQQKAANVIATEVARLNSAYRMPAALKVSVRYCGKDRALAAFYTPGRARITICTEYIDRLRRQARKYQNM